MNFWLSEALRDGYGCREALHKSHVFFLKSSIIVLLPSKETFLEKNKKSFKLMLRLGHRSYPITKLLKT